MSLCTDSLFPERLRLYHQCEAYCSLRRIHYPVIVVLRISVVNGVEVPLRTPQLFGR